MEHIASLADRAQFEHARETAFAARVKRLDLCCTLLAS